jgi:hypothetical protein
MFQSLGVSFYMVVKLSTLVFCGQGNRWSESRDISCGLEPLPIRECNEKCGCPTSCSNRVVQRGMTHAFEVIYDIHYIL